MKLLSYWQVVVNPDPTQSIGASAFFRPYPHFFSTERKLEKWRKTHSEEDKRAVLTYCEISDQCAKELIRQSKKKVRRRCHECGK